MLECNTYSQESVIDSLSHVVKRLNRDLDNVCRNVFKIQGIIKTLENNDQSMSTQLEPIKGDLSQIRCKIDNLSGSHRNMQKSVDIAQTDIQEMKDDITAMHAQLDELSAGAHVHEPNEPNVLVQEVNQTVVPDGLEQTSILISDKSEPIDDKKWYFTGDGDSSDIVKKFKEQLEQQEKKIKDLELIINAHNSDHIHVDQSLVESIKGVLKQEMKEISTNSQHQSQDPGNGSLVIGRNVMRQFSEDNTSLKGTSSQHAFATQQSFLSSASSASSFGGLESSVLNSIERPITTRKRNTSSGIEFDVTGSESEASIPNVHRSFSDPTDTPIRQSCNGCNERIDKLIKSLHVILETHLNQNNPP